MNPARSHRLQRSDRLRDRRDFQRMSREGMRVTTQSFLLLCAEPFHAASVPVTRLGVTVSKRVGESVERNRVKRRIREWFRQNRETLPRGRDVVVVARAGAAALSSATIHDQLSAAAQRLSAGSARARA